DARRKFRPRTPPPRRVVDLLGFLDALLAGNGLARPLAGAGVGAGALAAAGQAATVADAPIAADVLQSGNVLLHLALQRTLDGVFPVEDRRDAGDLLVVQLARLAQRIDAGLGTQLQRRRRPDADDVAQRDVRRFVVGEVNTQDTRHGL